MELKDFIELSKQVDDFKPFVEAIHILIDEFGKDLEKILERIVRSLTRLQIIAYKEYIDAGFTENQALHLVLSTKFALENFNKNK